MKNINKKEIGLWIKRIRIFDLEMSQIELAKEIGKNPQDISHYENGRNMPPADIIFRIERLMELLKQE